MDKKKIITKVVEKLSLEKGLQQFINTFLNSSKELDGLDCIENLKNQVKEHNISDENFAKIVESLVKQHHLHLKSDIYRKELKKLVINPPLKIYLQGLIF